MSKCVHVCGVVNSSTAFLALCVCVCVCVFVCVCAHVLCTNVHVQLTIVRCVCIMLNTVHCTMSLSKLCVQCLE